MHDIDERMQIIKSKAVRRRRRDDKAIIPALSLCAVLLGMGLIGAIGGFAGAMTPASVVGLYGSASLLGGEVGGYVIVALISFALAVVLTLIFVRKALGSAFYKSIDTAQKDERHD